MNNERKNKREVIPFETNRIADTDLAEGEELTLIHGQDGLRVWGEDGEVARETEPVTQVVAYGPESRVIPPGEIRTVNNDLDQGVETVVSEGYTGLQLVDESGKILDEYAPLPSEIEYGPTREEVPFETIRRPNNDLQEGEENILISGETGLQLVDEEGDTTLVEEPRAEEVEYGPKRVPIPFEVKRVPNNDLAEGESQIVEPGVEGLKLVDEAENAIPVSDPEAEIVEYGPARLYISFSTERVSNSDLDEGEEKVVTAGVEGLQLEDEEGQITDVSEPVTEVIEYGPVRHYIPFETKRVSNPDLEEDEEKVVTAGVEGLQLEDEEGEITDVSEPVTEVIEYGPVRHYIPFETERVSNPDLEEAQEKIVTPGEQGLKFEDEEGQVSHDSDPVTEVIEYGPIRHHIPFETKRVADPDLGQGEESVATSGVEGLELEDEEGQITPVSEPVTEIVSYGPTRHYIPFTTARAVNLDLEEGQEQVATEGKEGIQMEDEEENQTLFSEPVTQVVEYGPKRITLPYETNRTVNTELTQGEEQVVVQGKEGLRLEDEEGKTIEVTEPRTKEVEYGPEFQVIPYETLRHPSVDLEEGEIIVLAKGIDGLKLLDEKGQTVETYDAFPKEIAYGPDEEERKKLEDNTE